MRVHNEKSIWVDEFSLDDSIEKAGIQGILNLTDEYDESGQIYFAIGTRALGFISKEDLVKLAEKILENWKPLGDLKNVEH